jgi:acyl carrier protein
MPNPFVSEERIEAEVRQALGATLRKDPGAIDMDASIVDALGATSIDFLDVNFRLESAFGLQLATQLVLDHVEEELGEGKAIDRENRITAAAAELLRLHLGPLKGLEEGMYADEVSALVTPRTITRAVAGILEHLPEACGQCGKSAWECEDGAKVRCGGCGKDAEYPSGDELTRRWIRQVEQERRLFASA